MMSNEDKQRVEEGLSEDDFLSLGRDLMCKQCPEAECDYDNGQCSGYKPNTK